MTGAIGRERKIGTGSGRENVIVSGIVSETEKGASAGPRMGGGLGLSVREIGGSKYVAYECFLGIDL
jgi:hypothetical protein